MNSIISFRGIDAAATGERIKTLRKKKGYTVDELCDIFFISPQAVYKWQNGKALPSLDNMLVLCDIFGVKVEDIVVREDAVSSVFFYFLLEIEKNRGSAWMRTRAQGKELLRNTRSAQACRFRHAIKLFYFLKGKK